MKTWPLLDPLGRLPRMLNDFGRSELWLHARRVYRCSLQNDQVTVDITDANGALLHDASGCGPWHTFQLAPQAPPISVGERFRVYQDSSGVYTEHVQPEAIAAD
jgi:hypothetical protein